MQPDRSSTAPTVAAMRIREQRAKEIVARMTADELAEHRTWLERHGEQLDPDDCAICAAMSRKEAP